MIPKQLKNIVVGALVSGAAYVGQNEFHIHQQAGEAKKNGNDQATIDSLSKSARQQSFQSLPGVLGFSAGAWAVYELCDHLFMK